MDGSEVTRYLYRSIPTTPWSPIYRIYNSFSGLDILIVLYGWVGEWLHGGMDGRMDAWLDGWVHGFMDGCMDAWMDRLWIVRWVDGSNLSIHPRTYPYSLKPPYVLRTHIYMSPFMYTYIGTCTHIQI